MRKFLLGAVLLAFSSVGFAQDPADSKDYQVRISIEVADSSGEVVSRVGYYSPKIGYYEALSAMSANTTVLADAWTKLLMTQTGPKAMGIRAAGGSGGMDFSTLGQ